MFCMQACLDFSTSQHLISVPQQLKMNPVLFHFVSAVLQFMLWIINQTPFPLCQHVNHRYIIYHPIFYIAD